MKTQLEVDLEAIAATLLAGACSDLLAEPERLERVAALAGVATERLPAVREALTRLHAAGLN